MNYFSLFLIFGVFLLFPTKNIHSQNIDPNFYYRLTTQWQGEGKSLDVLNDGKDNNKLILNKTGEYTGQFWKLTPVGNGYYRITCQWQGDGKSLDIVNDGKNNNQPILAKTGPYSGQYWKFTAVGNGYYRLTSQWQGPGKSLDIVNDGKNNNKTVLAKTANYTGQFWKLTKLGRVSNQAAKKETISPIAWITLHYEQLKNRPLNRLVLPGSHDSGTYDLDGTWSRGVSDAFAPDTDDKKRGLSFLGDGYTKWAKAQERSIYQQLEDGIRYLDIRVCVDKSGQFKTCHGLYGVSLNEVINDVVKFANKYPKEPLLIDFNHFYDWDEKTRNGKDNNASYQGIRTTKLDELASMIERTIGPRLAPNSLNPSSTLQQLMDSGRPIIVLWDKTPRGAFQSKYFWRSNEINSSYSDKIKELRNDKIFHLDQKIRENQNTSNFFLLAGQITPSNDLYIKGNDPTSTYPFGLENIAKQSNPVVLSYVANEWKNLQHNIIFIDFYNQTSLVALCKQLNGLPAKPKGVSVSDRNKSTWGKWRAGIVPESDEFEWKVEIDACHSDLDNTGTNNRITVQFYAGSTLVASKYKDGVSDGCKIWEGDTVFSTKTNRKITHVIVKTNGSDGFYIDEIRLYEKGALKQHHGRDNGSGWCLSTDPKDANGSWKGKVSGNTCKSSHRFNY